MYFLNTDFQLQNFFYSYYVIFFSNYVKFWLKWSPSIDFLWKKFKFKVIELDNRGIELGIYHNVTYILYMIYEPTGTFPFVFSTSLFSNRGALLLFPPISTLRGSGFNWRLAAEGEDGALGGVSNNSPELSELLAVVDRPVK